MIVGLCGMGYSGSGAVRDLLKEFSEISVGKDVELSFLYDPDGIMNLENGLVKNPIRFYSGDACIKRFIKYMNSYDLCQYMERGIDVHKYKEITHEYINSITASTYRGFWHFDKRNVDRLMYMIKFKIGWKFLRAFDKLGIDNTNMLPIMYIPIAGDEFYECTKHYLTCLLTEMNPKRKEIIVLDQPFPTNNPSSCFKFFDEECKAIIITKDPRDLYCFVKKYGGLYSRFMPSNDVNSFIKFYTYQMNLISSSTKYNTNYNTIIIRFEDLIYQYEQSLNQIMTFLGLKDHTTPRKHFKPDVSIGNSQIFRKCPEYKRDIDIIEMKLEKYLYPFDIEKYNEKAIPFLA